VSVFAANEINSFLKGLFGRTWPESWLGDNPSWIRDGVFGFFPFHGGLAWTSFPSGHTTTITATAAILWVVCPELKVAWAALVAVVVTGLIAGNYHFVSDVIAGLYLGAGIGLGLCEDSELFSLSTHSGNVDRLLVEGSMSAGANVTDSSPPTRRPSRASRRHINNWLADRPLRRAVADTSRGAP